MLKGAVWTVVKMVYRTILRPLVKKAIDDPESEVDEFVLMLLDNLFEYKTE